MSWLTQINLDLAAAARRRLFDNYDWHQVAWQCFQGRDGRARDFLTRVDQSPQGFRLLIVSPEPPTRPEWCSQNGWQSREIPAAYFKQSRYAFQLRANPTKKIIDATKPKAIATDGRINRNKNAHRVPLRTPAELSAWLDRKGVSAGFTVEPDSLRIIPEGQDHFNKAGRRGAHASVEFRGTLRVTDGAAFQQAFESGLGSAKAFGFGLLVLAPLD
jgi:CRISPR system Cascade subunit CasE